MRASGPQSQGPRGAGPLELAREAPAFLHGPFASRPARLAGLEAGLHSGGDPPRAGGGLRGAGAAGPGEGPEAPEGPDRDAASLAGAEARHRGRLAQAPAGRAWAWGGGLARAAEAERAPAREDWGRRF